MNNFKSKDQQGAVLIVALVMLLVLTVLAVSNMRGVTLESRITANRIETGYLDNLANAALREGEFRFYGPAYLRDKLEPNIGRNCIKENQLNIYGNNRPCLLREMTDDELGEYFTTPISFFKTDNDYTSQYENKTGAAAQAADENAIVAWMPYRGLDADASNYFIPEKSKNAFWNTYRAMSGSVENESVNPEYGAALEGKGTFFFLVTAQANDQLAAQSTVAVIYLGLN